MSLSKPKRRVENETVVRELTSSETVKVTFNLNKELHKKAKQKALDLDTTVTALIEAGLKDMLTRR